MCNENDKINMSVWTVDRIKAEQDKHITPYAINPIDKNRLDDAIMKDLSIVDSLDSEINKYMRKVQEQSDMYRICEIAKLYIESQRPAEWVVYKDNYGNDKPVCSCCNKEQVGYANYCSYCGRRMKNGT